MIEGGSTDKTAGKQRGKPFVKGQSGNPNGRPEGSRNKATILAQALLNGQAEELIQQCIEKALDGDGMAMRLCIERLVPPRKDSPVNLDLPKMERVDDTVKAMAVISSGVADGELTPSEGQVLSGMVENYRKAIETTELEERISNLEKRKN
jgi:hypothetical protein